MNSVSSVDGQDGLDALGAVGVHDVQVVDGDARDAAGSTGADAAPDATAEPPDTDEAVALVATELRLRLGAVAASARDDAGQAKAATTLRASRADWAACTAWCASTLQRRLSAISQAHQPAGHPAPTRDSVVRPTWAGIRLVAP